MGRYSMTITGRAADHWIVRFTWSGYPGGTRVIADERHGNARDAMIRACGLATSHHLEHSAIEVHWSPPMPDEHDALLAEGRREAARLRDEEDTNARRLQFERLKMEFDPPGGREP